MCVCGCVRLGANRSCRSTANLALGGGRRCKSAGDGLRPSSAGCDLRGGGRNWKRGHGQASIGWRPWQEIVEESDERFSCHACALQALCQCGHSAATRSTRKCQQPPFSRRGTTESWKAAAVPSVSDPLAPSIIMLTDINGFFSSLPGSNQQLHSSRHTHIRVPARDYLLFPALLSLSNCITVHSAHHLCPADAPSPL